MGMTRRRAVLLMAAAPTAIASAGHLASAAPEQPDSAGAPSPSDQFTEPPGPLTEAELELLSEAALAARTNSVSELVCDPRFMLLHPHPAFRGLIQGVAREGDLRLAGDAEPGERIIASGRVVTQDGHGIVGAVMYAYQTSAKGWYSDRAAHIRASNGDDRHARLFGYLRTAEDGAFEIHTVRPGGYPHASLPAHIHVAVERPGFRLMVTELLFSDDPRLTPESRQRAVRNGFVVAEPELGRGGITRYRYSIALSPA